MTAPLDKPTREEQLDAGACLHLGHVSVRASDGFRTVYLTFTADEALDIADQLRREAELLVASLPALPEVA